MIQIQLMTMDRDWETIAAAKAGLLTLTVTPDPIVILPDPELVVISPTFKIPFAIII